MYRVADFDENKFVFLQNTEIGKNKKINSFSFFSIKEPGHAMRWLQTVRPRTFGLQRFSIISRWMTRFARGSSSRNDCVEPVGAVKCLLANWSGST
jgi:hypothetical protein